MVGLPLGESGSICGTGWCGLKVDSMLNFEPGPALPFFQQNFRPEQKSGFYIYFRQQYGYIRRKLGFCKKAGSNVDTKHSELKNKLGIVLENSFFFDIYYF